MGADVSAEIAASQGAVQTLDRGEGRIAYEVSGEGPLVVCVPGMGDLRSTFRHLAPALREAGYRVAVFDLRGHGDSDTTFSAYDDLAAGKDAIALVEHLGGPAILVGNSMGAGACAWAAAERPDLVSDLVLLAPFVRQPKLSLPMRAALRMILWRPWGPAMLKVYLAKAYPGRRSADVEAHRERMLASLRRPGYWPAFIETTHTSHAPVEARLAEVKARTLVVMGEKDPDFPDPAAEAEAIRQQLRSARIVMVPNAGHYPQGEFPERVNPAVIAFLRDTSAHA